MEYSPAGDLADSPRTGEAGPRPAAGVGGHSPLVCEAITCSAPVYVLVFTCGRPGSRNLRSCPTRPAPIGDRRAALFSHPRQVRDSRAPGPLGVPVGPWRCSRDCKGNPQGASFPECTCVRVFVCPKCVGLSTRVYGPVGEFPCRFPVQAPRLHPPPPAQSGTPFSLRPPASLDRESSLRSRDVREAGVPTPPPPHHSPRATCAAAPAPAQLLLQHGDLLAADPPARSQLRAPDSGRPPGPAW